MAKQLEIPKNPQENPDPWGCVSALEAALRDPSLKTFDRDQDVCLVTDSQPAEACRAAYWLALQLGRCRVFGVDLGARDGTLQFNVAMAAIRHLRARIVDWRRKFEELPRQLKEIDDDFLADDIRLNLLGTMMDSWAAYVAIDESLEDCEDSDAPQAFEFCQRFCELIKDLKRLDVSFICALKEMVPVAECQAIKNWRGMVVREAAPQGFWWMDVLKEEAIARGLLPAAEVNS